MTVSVKMVGVVVVAVAVVAVLVGCAKKAAEPVVQRPPQPRPAPLVAEFNTLADVWGKLNANSSYQVTMTTTMPDGKSVAQLVKLQDGRPVKAKFADPDGDGLVLVEMDEQVMYMYSPKDNRAMKMELSAMKPEEGQGRGVEAVVLGPDSIVSGVALKTTQTLDGVECWVVETTTTPAEGESEQAKIWVDQATGLPVQVEGGGEVTKLAYDRFNEVPDSEFELPEGIEIVDMG